jgi:aspartyl-tRNA synthetase
MSFVRPNDVFKVLEPMIVEVFRLIDVKVETPFPPADLRRGNPSLRI